MKALTKAFLYTIKEDIQNVPLIAIMLFFPIVLILILGSALSTYFSEVQLPKTQILVVEEPSQFSIYKNILLTDKTFQKLFDPDYSSSYNQSKLQFEKSSKFSALIHIKYLKNSPANTRYLPSFDIEIFTKENSTNVAFVKAYFNIFSNYYKTLQHRQNDFQIPDIIFESAMATRLPRALDYYAVTMVVMIALYGAMGGSAVIETEKRQNTITRLYISPQNPLMILMSKAMAQLVFLYAQLCIIVLFSKYIYKANWGNNISAILLVLLIYSIFAVFFGLCIALLTRNLLLSNVLISSFAVASTFIAGGYFIVDIRPGLLQTIRNLLPNYVVQSSLFTLIYNPSEVGYVKHSVIYLIVLCLSLAVISLFLLRKVKVCQFLR
ncbi:ABC transporter permease [Caldicellulosiruptor acetigenus]|uniref:ABC-2 type transporter n=1 Tax=Caldicellulosiruptor acetigenus 6A TaxID=632516 RepID=G2PXF2_9FIRM|nr:ABC transporter permease [Caldicellulosiruptor acetigenus]AEM74816.1 ABC-2 type transporter [Caldicellulosiruptor acetigenus 6A]WAM36157.1 ABC transporter permease [Caldicellulosiruptor acetigenus]